MNYRIIPRKSLNLFFDCCPLEQIIEDYSLVAVLLTFILGPCPLMTTPMGDTVLISGEGERGNDLETAVWTVIQAIAKHSPLSLLTLHGVPM